MNTIKFLLIFFIFLHCSLICYGDYSNSSAKFGTKVFFNGDTPSSVANKANKNSSFNSAPYSAIMQDPIINSTLNGYSNLIQGINGGSYSPLEMQKQQMDYSMQQTEFPAD